MDSDDMEGFEEEEILPTDMLDEDVDFENSAFFKKRRKLGGENDEEGMKSKAKHFLFHFLRPAVDVKLFFKG